MTPPEQTPATDPPRSFRLAAVRHAVVGSTNPVKIAAVRAVLARAGLSADVRGVDVASGVADQPWGDDETIRGATRRARAALEATAAEIAVGIEGGVVDAQDTLRTCAWAVVAERGGRIGLGGSLAMPLPRPVAELVRAGVELGHAMDRVAGVTDTKRGAGAVGILTAGLVDRQQAYESLVAYALAPFLTPAYYDGDEP